MYLQTSIIGKWNVIYDTLQEWASKNYRAMPSGLRNFSSARWMGLEFFSRKMLFSSGAPPVINNDRSLNHRREILDPLEALLNHFLNMVIQITSKSVHLLRHGTLYILDNSLIILHLLLISCLTLACRLIVAHCNIIRLIRSLRGFPFDMAEEGISHL